MLVTVKKKGREPGQTATSTKSTWLEVGGGQRVVLTGKETANEGERGFR